LSSFIFRGRKLARALHKLQGHCLILSIRHYDEPTEIRHIFQQLFFYLTWFFLWKPVNFPENNLQKIFKI
jgi:hypothetical protein